MGDDSKAVKNAIRSGLQHYAREFRKARATSVRSDYQGGFITRGETRKEVGDVVDTWPEPRNRPIGIVPSNLSEKLQNPKHATMRRVHNLPHEAKTCRAAF